MPVNMFQLTRRGITQKRERVCRFITYWKTGEYTVGSGFFVDKTKGFLSCFHVAFGQELRVIRTLSILQSINGTDEHSRLVEFYKQRMERAEVEFSDGVRFQAKMIDFDEKYDIALFSIAVDPLRIKTCCIDWKSSVEHGDRVFFGGFPIHHDYRPDKTPYAAHEGIISSFIETTVGGERYEHMQINSINLGGNSGAPLFRGDGTTVIGIINGNMLWGRNDLIVGDPATNKFRQTEFRTPLSIAYATPMRLVRDFALKPRFPGTQVSGDT